MELKKTTTEKRATGDAAPANVFDVFPVRFFIFRLRTLLDKWISVRRLSRGSEEKICPPERPRFAAALGAPRPGSGGNSRTAAPAQLFGRNFRQLHVSGRSNPIGHAATLLLPSLVGPDFYLAPREDKLRNRRSRIKMSSFSLIYLYGFFHTTPYLLNFYE